MPELRGYRKTEEFAAIRAGARDAVITRDALTFNAGELFFPEGDHSAEAQEAIALLVRQKHVEQAPINTATYRILGSGLEGLAHVLKKSIVVRPITDAERAKSEKWKQALLPYPMKPNGDDTAIIPLGKNPSPQALAVVEEMQNHGWNILSMQDWKEGGMVTDILVTGHPTLQLCQEVLGLQMEEPATGMTRHATRGSKIELG